MEMERISAEPKIKVGICEGYGELRIILNGLCDLAGRLVSGPFRLVAAEGLITVLDEEGKTLLRQREILFRPTPGATFTIGDVTIGVAFHWERKQEETFLGDLRLIMTDDRKITAINEIGLEDYLASVISSEMNARAPEEFLKAHAIMSRSWLGAMVSREQKKTPSPAAVTLPAGERLRWYDREEHGDFDVCADDHCQRYQGLPEHHGGRAGAAVQATRGLFLTSDGEICDARYHKACGGLTEEFATAWEDKKVPYLTSVADGAINYPPLHGEEGASAWILASPPAYCNTCDPRTLENILPSFDRETESFFRWQVSYCREELEEIIASKAGVAIGNLTGLVPLSRGPSGRIFRLQLLGTKGSLIVGKELEIRRLLSRSHLLSSAFAVFVEGGSSRLPARFILRGAGWGHGVGLCQIGAAVMATQGRRAEEILGHYFRGASLHKLYG